MNRSMGQSTSTNRSLKEKIIRRPFANLSFLSNSFNIQLANLDESTLEKVDDEFNHNQKDEDGSSASDYDGSKSCKSTKRRELEDVIEGVKMTASEKFFNNYQKNDQKNNKGSVQDSMESGDFLVLEFFKVVLPLVVGTFDLYFCAFICTVDNKTKQIHYDELGSFLSVVNGKNSKGSVVRELFLKRPPFNTTNTEIYLLVHCYGDVVKRKKTALINCIEGVGISRIGKWTLEQNSRLSAQIDYSNKAVYIEENRCYEMDIGMLTNWKPSFEIFQRLRDTFLNRKSKDMCSFLSMELSNENGIGDFDQSSSTNNTNTTNTINSVQQSQQSTINKYVFFMSPKQNIPIVSRQSKEDSVGHSSSSGYGSMPSSSTTSTERGSVELEKTLNFTVESNACVICSSKFNTITELLLHLEFRYPSLKFTYDPSLASQINVAVPDASISKSSFKPSSTKSDYLLLNRSLIKQYRCRILSKLFGRRIREPTPIEVQELEYRPAPLELETCPLPFNPPIYQKVSFDGMYGVETSIGWLETFQNRKLNEFVDVSADEKEMMKLWNRFINHRENRDVTKTTCNLLVTNFVKEHAKEIMTNKQLGIRQFLPHVTILFKKGLVDTEVIEEALKVLLNVADGRTSPLRKPINGSLNRKTNSSQTRTPGRPPNRHKTSTSTINSSIVNSPIQLTGSKRLKLDENLTRKRGRPFGAKRSLERVLDRSSRTTRSSRSSRTTRSSRTSTGK